MEATDRHAWSVDAETFPWDGPPYERGRFLVRHAVLAPSSHNSQPWRFVVDDHGVDVHVDLERWLRVADADRRELYVSVGCALENLSIAASRFGYLPQAEYVPDASRPEWVARLRLARPPTGGSIGDRALFDAIPERHTTRAPFDDAVVSAATRDAIVAAGAEGDARIVLSDDVDLRKEMDRRVVRADAEQFADPAFREELGRWIGDGAFGQGWLVAKLAKLAVTHLDLVDSTQRRDSDALLHAPLIGFVVSSGNDVRSRLEAGRALERAWLRAESLGVRLHPMNQVLQVPSVSSDLGAVAHLEGALPQIFFRLGHAEPAGHPSPRRPLDDVVSAAAETAGRELT